MAKQKINNEAIDEIIKALNRIPEKIESQILIDEIAEALNDKLKTMFSQ